MLKQLKKVSAQWLTVIFLGLLVVAIAWYSDTRHERVGDGCRGADCMQGGR
jgi:hypothetical protein